jgi:hypothetical protein
MHTYPHLQLEPQLQLDPQLQDIFLKGFGTLDRCGCKTISKCFEIAWAHRTDEETQPQRLLL